MPTTKKPEVTWGGDREPGSVMKILPGATLRTACGHSFATCHIDRCFRLPPEMREERDRLLAAEQIEHNKNIAAEARRFDAAKRRIEDTYRNLAAEGQIDGFEPL